MSCPHYYQTVSALRRVFVQSKANRPLTLMFLVPWQQQRQQGTWTPVMISGERRSASRQPSRGDRMIDNRLSTPPRKPREFLPPRAQRTFDAPYDEEITAPWISLVDRDGTYHKDIRRSEALRKVDREAAEHLVQVSPEDKEHPTCRIYSKQELREIQQRKLDAEKERKKTARSAKALEFNWAIDSGDLDMKINQFKKFLQEGRRVEVVLARKRGSRLAEEAECRRLLLKIRGAAMNVKSKELGAAEGQIGKKLRLKFEGAKVKEPKAAENSAQAVASEVQASPPEGS